MLEPRLATDADLERVHAREHIDALVATRGRATMIDEDTFTSPESEEIARLAAVLGWWRVSITRWTAPRNLARS